MNRIMDAKQIEMIINSRAAVASKVEKHLGDWRIRRERVDSLKAGLKELNKVCLRAQSSGADAFADLLKVIGEFEDSGTIRKLIGKGAFAETQLGKLQQRFNRKTLNIAVAGVGRSGKSTALKAIIGQNQDDNSTIPSGGGPAVTAGKSVICCVANEAEEHTEVVYHTAESFLAVIVNPLLNSISLGDYACASLDAFADLDFDILKEALARNDRRAADAVKDAQRSLPQAENAEEAKARLVGAQAYSASFRLKYERLNDLKRIMDAFLYFRDSLTGSTDNIPLSETARYVSYPKNGGPAICYAVRECRIYSRFPNNEVNSLVLTDLPGLGTGSESERKCFFEGFDYAVDLALMVRRPVGLFQNFTTDDDLAVLDVLGKTFGEEHLHECTVLFQNDGGLDADASNQAFAKITEWNALRPRAVEVIRGDAYNASFMQNELLPKVLEFIGRNLRALDAALIAETMPSVENAAKEFDAALTSVITKLASFKRVFTSGRSANAVGDKADGVIKELTAGLTELLEYYGEKFLEIDTRQSEAITGLVDEAKALIGENYSTDNAELLKDVAIGIVHAQSAATYANPFIHALRIAISEVFSKLESIHAEQVADMQQKVADKLCGCFPAMFSTEKSIAVFLTAIEESGCCAEIVDAVRDLAGLEVPFYNILYPDLRKEVFVSVAELEENFRAISRLPREKQAKAVLMELQNVGINWIWKAERLLRSQSRIRDIICAAIERFLDRMVRNDRTRPEFVDFIDRNWSALETDADAFAADVHRILEKLTA